MSSEERDNQVVELTTSNGEVEEPKMIELFRLDGESYYIPEKPRMVIALRYLNDLRRHGEDVAAANMLPELLGEEGFEALVEYDDLRPEQFEQVMKVAQEVVMAGLDPTGRRVRDG